MKIKLKISSKITIPTIFMVTFIIIVLSILGQKHIKKTLEEQTTKIMRDKLSDFNTNLERLSNQALYSASFCAEIPFVEYAYNRFYSSKNLYSSSSILEKNFKNITKSIKKNTGIEAKMHFHLASGRSFVRLWRKKRGDDLLFRSMIKRIKNNHSAISGAEIGNDGIYIRGLAPIFSSTGNEKYLGSVEVLLPLIEVIKTSKLNEKEDFGLYLNKEKIKKTSMVRLKSKNKLLNKMGNFSFIARTSKNYKSQFIDSTILKKAMKEGFYIFEKNNFKIAAIPIKDFEKNEIGVVVFQLNIKENNESLKKLFNEQLQITIYSVIIASLLLIFLVRFLIKRPLSIVNEKIKIISQRKIIDKLEIKTYDEISEISISVNKLIDGMISSSKFANEIEKGNFELKFKAISKDDVLGNALINMRKSLHNAKTNEKKRQKEDEQRNWTSVGIAKFSEILRENTDDLKKLSYEIIKNLMPYLDAQMSNLYIYKKAEKPYLEIITSYAYEKEKDLNKKYFIGENLVGICAKEKKTIFLKKLPENYLKISSGMGDVNASSLLIVPLITNEEIFGILEIASLKEIKNYQINFVETIAESIASTLSISEMNTNKNTMLETLKKQTEQMKIQEKMMEESIEDILITRQENIKKSENDLLNVLEKLENDFFVTEFNKYAMMENMSKSYEKLLNIDKMNFKNIHFSKITEFDSESAIKIMDKMEAGKIESRLFKTKKQGEIINIKEIFFPIMDKENVLKKIFIIGFNINI